MYITTIILPGFLGPFHQPKDLRQTTKRRSPFFFCLCVFSLDFQVACVLFIWLAGILPRDCYIAAGGLLFHQLTLGWLRRSNRGNSFAFLGVEWLLYGALTFKTFWEHLSTQFFLDGLNKFIATTTVPFPNAHTYDSCGIFSALISHMIFSTSISSTTKTGWCSTPTLLLVCSSSGN